MFEKEILSPLLAIVTNYKNNNNNNVDDIDNDDDGDCIDNDYN